MDKKEKTQIRFEIVMYMLGEDEELLKLVKDFIEKLEIFNDIYLL